MHAIKYTKIVGRHSLVSVLIRVGELALDKEQDLLPHGKLKLYHAQLPPLIAQRPATCKGDIV